MIKKEDLASFKKFSASSGLKEAKNLTLANKLSKKASTASDAYTSSIDDSADYSSNSAGGLVSAAKSLASELSKASSVCASVASYIKEASTPTDLQQVSLGVQVYNEVHDISEETPGKSFAPIVDKVLLNELEQAIDQQVAYTGEFESIITQVNDLIVVPPALDGAVAMLPKPVPQALKVKIAALETKLVAVRGVVEQSSDKVQSMLNNAKSERIEAIKLFNQAVAFLVCSGLTKSPITKQVVSEIFDE